VPRRHRVVIAVSVHLAREAVGGDVGTKRLSACRHIALAIGVAVAALDSVLAEVPACRAGAGPADVELVADGLLGGAVRVVPTLLATVGDTHAIRAVGVVAALAADVVDAEAGEWSEGFTVGVGRALDADPTGTSATLAVVVVTTGLA
jgi:hypothetical protein